MSLRAVAEADLATILEDDVFGFAWPITLTDPDGLVSVDLKGRSNDVRQVIDPDMGQQVTVRTVSVSLRISTLIAQGFTDLPRNVLDTGTLPWVVTFDDINGASYTFRVIEGFPDRTLGIITCELDLYG